ncbi:MAG: hypothetical protein M3P18_22200 [Actinomycetota bacterium]|nr:hypothetical protein [Actinomycetota bacterium]
MTASRTDAVACDTCGTPMPPYAGPGRPRKRCRACAADKPALGQAWRASHPTEVASYRAKQREALLADRVAKGSARAAAQLASLRRKHQQRAST